MTRSLPGRLVLPAVLAMLSACASRPPAPVAIPTAEVTADVRAGAAKSFKHCTWYPDSAGFSRSPRAPRPDGELLLMNDALSWGQFDTGKGLFRAVRTIPFAQLRGLALAQKDGQRMLVVEGEDGRVDSFAIVVPGGRGQQAGLPDPAATTEAYRFLLGLLGLASPDQNKAS